MSEERIQKSGRLKIAIIILSVLLVLSAGGLAARMIYLHFFAPVQTTAAVPDNLIGDGTSEPEDNAGSTGNTEPSDPTASEPGPVQSGGTDSSTVPGSTGTDKPAQAKVLELYQGKPDDNQRFEVQNMLPGDTETKYFCIRAYHDKDVELFFRADVTEQTKALGEVLHIIVTHLETGKVLCDAPFSEINGAEFSELLKANGDKATTAYYKIDVSLATSVGNEYQAALLKANFNWYVKDTGGLTPPPQTGDTTNLTLWIVLAASSLLLMFRRRKEDGQHEQA